MQITKNYIEANKDRFLEELFGLIRIPSISSESAHKPDMIRCAEYWRDHLLKAGADKAEVMPTEGNPIVYGEKIIDPKLPTVLVYGHYDVMPVDPIDLWHTDPFEPIIKDGKIWARGADDDKGQSFMHAKAFETMVKTNTLPCNVKFMLEGEEEIGSGSLSKWVAEYKDLVKADVILVSDTKMTSAFTKFLYFTIHLVRLPEPISSSPSSMNFTLQGSESVFTMVSKALACMNDCPLSSSAPRAQMRPSFTTGSKGLVFHNSMGSTGITS